MSRSLIANLTCACFLLGILVSPFFAFLTGLKLCVGGLLCSATKSTRLFGLLGIGFSAGILLTLHWQAQHRLNFPDTSLTLQGTISKPPDVRPDKTLLTVHLENTKTNIQVTAPRYPAWHYGDFIQVVGIVEKPVAFNGFNYPLYLERYAVYGLMRHPSSLTLMGHNRGSPIISNLYKLRDKLEHSIQHVFPEPEASFLAGILLGSKQSIPEQIQNALRETGTSHIIAISGANITILLNILLLLLPLYTPYQKLGVVILVGSFITLLTGASASVMRGALLAIFACYLRLHGRRAWATPLILTSMIIMVIGNPLLLRADPGFQLSFAAFAGLVYLGSPLQRLVEQAFLTRNWPEIIRSALAETLAATLGTAPLSLLLFHQLSFLGLVVNPLILWLLPAITWLGLCLIALGWLHPLIMIMKIPLWLLLHLVLAIIQFFSHFTFATIHLAPP